MDIQPLKTFIHDSFLSQEQKTHFVNELERGDPSKDFFAALNDALVTEFSTNVKKYDKAMDHIRDLTTQLEHIYQEQKVSLYETTEKELKSSNPWDILARDRAWDTYHDVLKKLLEEHTERLRQLTAQAVLER